MAYGVRKNTYVYPGTYNADEGGLVRETIYGRIGTPKPGKAMIFSTREAAQDYIVDTIGCDDWSDDNKRFWKSGTYFLRAGENNRPDWTIVPHNGRGGNLIG